MKSITAVRFRIILSAALVIVAGLIIAAFILGYRHLQTVGQETVKRQADATASDNTVANLQRLRVELEQKSDVVEKLRHLKSGDSLPQFDTERSLRTIAGQIGLPVKEVNFINAEDPSGGGSSGATQSSSASAAASGTVPTSAGWGGSRNARISFSFKRKISYSELINFLNAIETSTPKLRVEGVKIPGDSNRNSIDIGTLTLELATQ